MGLFSGLTSSGEPLVPMDDNAAVADAGSNPYLSVTIPQVQAAYDTMYSAVEYLLKGKNASLKQIDKWLEKWEKSLDRIAKKYEEILQAFDDTDAAFQGMLSLDLLQEAWDILQDFPILRRYMGEANYWALYDTLGLLTTQAGSIGADLSTALKEAIKAAIRALLAMTDGLMSLESYLGMITQYWGALYAKSIPLPLLDSIVPNVTCSYYYKKTQTSTIGGTVIDNPVPGPTGFVPIPVPIPDPAYAVSHFGSDLIPDLQDPSTWVDENGTPKFLNISAMQDALAYWGSSYSNENLPLVSALYSRRPYLDEQGSEIAHPLLIGKTFAQLDTSLSRMAASTQGAPPDVDSLPELLGEHYDEFLQLFKAWQLAFAQSRTATLQVLERIPRVNEKVVAEQSQFLDALNLSSLSTPAQVPMGIDNMDMLNSESLVYDEEGATDAMAAYLDAVFGAHDSSIYHKLPRRSLLTGPVRLITRTILQRYAEIKGYEASTDKELFEYGRELIVALGQATIARAKNYTVEGSELALGPAMVSVFGRTEIKPAQAYTMGSVTWTEDYVERPDLFVYVADSSKMPSGSTGGKHMFDCSDVIADATRWVSLPLFDVVPPNPFDVLERALVLPISRRSLPTAFEASGTGDSREAYSPSNGTTIGKFPDALNNPAAWDYQLTDLGIPTCPYFPTYSVSGRIPTTIISKYLDLVAEKAPEEASLDEEVAEAVGYAVLKGREVYAACFGVYGNLLKMASWNFASMPTLQFNEKYTRVSAGSDLFYDKSDPTKIVFKHSTFYSVTMSAAYTIFHGAMAQETVTRGSESYAFSVFPCESISVHKIRQGSLDELWPVDAEGPDGSQYHYVTMRNVVPKCPKYVEPDKWSIIDIIHELYLMIWGISPLCGDNGDRQAKLEAALSDFGLTPAEFVGQLPEDDGKLANFKITLFDKYATRIKTLVDSIYGLRERILAATEAW